MEKYGFSVNENQIIEINFTGTAKEFAEFLKKENVIIEPTKTIQEVLEYCKEQRQSFDEERQKAGEIGGYNSVGFGMFDGHCEAYNNIINFMEGNDE